MAIRVRSPRSSANHRIRLDFSARILLAISVLSVVMFWQQHLALVNTTSSKTINDLSSTASAVSFMESPAKSRLPVPAKDENARQGDQSGAVFPLATTNHHPSIRFHTCTIANKTVSFPTVPHFIIAGAQKSGTTAFYEFLNEHPDIQASSTTETHFFDWYIPADFQREDWLTERGWPKDLPEQDMPCALRKVYTDNFNVTAPTIHTTFYDDDKPKIYFEKTPSYLFLTKIPELITEICFWKPNIVVILRNPIDRAISHFRMRVRTFGRSFEELIDEEIAHLKLIGLSNAPLRTDDYLPDDPRFAIPKLTKERSEELHWKHYRKIFACNFLQRGMYITQLNHWFEYFPLYDGGVHQHHEGKPSLLALNHEQFKKEPDRVFSRLLKFIGASPFVPAEGFQTSINSHEYRGDKMLPETRTYLSAFFRPYNEMLADTLGEEWRGIWEQST